jgi:hypothetical protein
MDIPVTDTSSQGYLILHVRLLSVLEVMSAMLVGSRVRGGGGDKEKQVAPDVPT